MKEVKNYSERETLKMSNQPDDPAEHAKWIEEIKAQGAPWTGSVQEGVEISSNAKGLAAALTNLTELAKSKSNLAQSYPIKFRGKTYVDSEAAYKAYKGTTTADGQRTVDTYRLMVEIITTKLEQHSRLVSAITKRGGSRWILSSTHQPTKQNSVWETGGKNWFIKALNEAYLSILLLGSQIATLKNLGGVSSNLQFTEDPNTGYAARTRINASADATIAIAVDFDSAGERLTRSSVLNQNKKYIPIDANNLTVTPERVNKIVEQLNSINSTELKVTANQAMSYKMSAKDNLTSKDTSTLELVEQDLRTATTRSFPLGKIGDIITFEGRPQKYRIIGVEQLTKEKVENSEWINQWSNKEQWTKNYFKEILGGKTVHIGSYQTTFEKVNESHSIRISLNIAGNGIYTMKGKYTQQQVDNFTYDLLKAVTESPNLINKIESIRTGGQTGFDEAGAKAGIRLGIPTIILAPKGWKFRDVSGTDISNEQAFKVRFD